MKKFGIVFATLALVCLFSAIFEGKGHGFVMSGIFGLVAIMCYLDRFYKTKHAKKHTKKFSSDSLN